MFEFVYKMTGSDEVSHYDIVLDREYSVDDFINHAISPFLNGYGSKINKFGRITIYDNDLGKWYGSDVNIDEGTYNYNNGKLLSKLSEWVLAKKVMSARAHGGWGAMDYSIVIQSYQPPLSFEEHIDKKLKRLKTMLDSRVEK